MVWTAPRTWVAGEKPPAATFNTHIRDNYNAIGAAWTSYTPTWGSSGTAPALGNGTLTGKYLNAGKLVYFQFILTAGTTTTYGTGNYTFTLPVTALTSTDNFAMSGLAWDASAALPYAITGVNNSTTTVRMAGNGGFVGATFPFTFANTDQIKLGGIYEAA